MKELVNIISRFDNLELLLVDFKIADIDVETIEELTEYLSNENHS